MPLLNTAKLCVGAQLVSAAYLGGTNLLQASVANPLRFATPVNTVSVGMAAATTGNNLKVIGRWAIPIGSTDMSTLVMSFYGWYMTATGGPTNFPNAFTVLKLALEKDGSTYSVPVTFSGGRSITINPGDTDIQSDPILPASFGLAKFSRGDRYWIRFEYTVASAGMKFPLCTIYNGLAGTMTGQMDITYNYTGTDSYGGQNPPYTGAYGTPYIPFILGKASAGGDFVSIMGIGDSILHGAGDTTASPYNGKGSFYHSLFASDLTSNPIGGCNFGVSGATGFTWLTTGSEKPRAYLKYAKYVYEEMAVNSISNLANSQSWSSSIWDYAIAAGCKVLRGKITPWTTSDGYTLANAYMQAGGNAHQFNDWIDTQSSKIQTVIPRNAVRLSSVTSSDDYFRWKDGSLDSTDGLHTIAAGCVLDATDIRPVFSSLT